MKGFTAFFILLLASVTSLEAAEPIAGKSIVPAEAMTRFVCRHNPDFDAEIAEAFIAVGIRYGIRGDVALCQAILETGWFKFEGGTAVTPDQHNYCGMGVTQRGLKGNSFETVEQGVEAMIQHLYAYCSKSRLPKDAEVLDPRFHLVTRGIAPHWEDLSMRWAMNPDYGRLILDLYDRLIQFAGLSLPADSEAAEQSAPDLF